MSRHTFQVIQNQAKKELKSIWCSIYHVEYCLNYSGQHPGHSHLPRSLLEAHSCMWCPCTGHMLVCIAAHSCMWCPCTDHMLVYIAAHSCDTNKTYLYSFHRSCIEQFWGVDLVLLTGSFSQARDQLKMLSNPKSQETYRFYTMPELGGKSVNYGKQLHLWLAEVSLEVRILHQ